MDEDFDENDNDFVNIPSVTWSTNKVIEALSDLKKRGFHPKTKRGEKVWVSVAQNCTEEEKDYLKVGHNLYVCTIKKTSTTSGGSQHRYYTFLMLI